MGKNYLITRNQQFLTLFAQPKAIEIIFSMFLILVAINIRYVNLHIPCLVPSFFITYGIAKKVFQQRFQCCMEGKMNLPLLFFNKKGWSHKNCLMRTKTNVYLKSMISFHLFWFFRQTLLSTLNEMVYKHFDIGYDSLFLPFPPTQYFKLKF